MNFLVVRHKKQSMNGVLFKIINSIIL